MIKVGIIGGAGYTAGELVRLLVNHPAAEIAWIHSESQVGKAVAEHHPGLVGDTDLVFTDVVDLNGIDVLFLCSAHGKSRAFWEEHPCPEGLKVVDLAQDFRDESDGYVYGLPELQRDRRFCRWRRPASSRVRFICRPSPVPRAPASSPAPPPTSAGGTITYRPIKS